MSESRTENDALERSLDALERLTSVANRWLNTDRLAPSSHFHAYHHDADRHTSRRKSRTPKYVETLLRNQVLYEAVTEIHAALCLNRCGVLLPSEDKTDFWHFSRHIGFPPEILAKGFYEVGEGLTGKVLLGDKVVSEDILGDARRSRKYGDRWITCDHSETSEGPYAYIGLPIWLQVTDLRRRANGALVCIRKTTPFTRLETACAANVSHLLSYALDRFGFWRQRVEADERQLQLSSLWQLPLSDQQKYEDLLYLLQEELPFKRLLLALVNNDQALIEGVAVVGFRPDLLYDTSRTIYEAAPQPEQSEDILALVCRMNWSAPFIVTQSDILWKHVHAVTAFRHQVENPLLLIPMMSFSHRVMGVVLAEMPDTALVLSQTELERFSLYANHAATLIESHQRRREALRINESWKRVHQEIFQPFDASDPEMADASLDRVILDASSVLHLEQVILYWHDEPNHILRGVTGHGVEPQECRRAVLSTRGHAQPPDASHSIAVRAFIANDIVRESDAEQIPVVDNLTLSPNGVALAVPLPHGEVCVGIVVVTIHEKHVRQPLFDSLRSVAAALGHMIANRAMATTLTSSQRETAALQSLTYGVGQLASSVGQSEGGSLHHFSREHASEIVSLLKDVSSIFDAALVQVFLRNEAQPVPAGLHEQMRSGEAAEYLECGVFVRTDLPPSLQDRVLVAPPVDNEPRKIYTADKVGLTASVLKTMQSQTSANVANDPLWSRRLIELDGPRTWIGVPLKAIHEGWCYDFGALTVTRLRYHDNDALVFGINDLRTAENIARLLSMALLKRHQFAEVSRRVRSCLRWFRHDIPAMINDIENEAALIVADINQKRLEDASQRAQHLEAFGRAVRSCFVAFGGVLDDGKAIKAPYEVNYKQIEEALRCLLERESRLGDTTVDIRYPSGSVSVAMDVHFLFYICFAMVHNAVLSCFLNRRKTTAANPGAVVLEFISKGNYLNIVVTDNGIGLPDDMKWFVECTSEGKSFWNRDDGKVGSGMGLFIVNRLLKMFSGKLTNAPSDKGATVCASIPMIQSAGPS